MLTKNIGDFGPMCVTVAGRYPPSTRSFDGERIKRTWSGVNPLYRYPQITGSSLDVRVSKQQLDGTQIGTGLQQTGGIGVQSIFSLAARQSRVGISKEMFRAAPVS